MNIIFINIPNVPFTDKSILIEPIDILTVATYIKFLGHRVSILDMDVKRMEVIELNGYFTNNPNDVAVFLYDYHIPLHNDSSIVNLLWALSICKDHNIKTIVGWKIATYRPEILFQTNNLVDIAISNEVELSLSRILENEDWNYYILTEIPWISFKNWDKLIRTDRNINKISLDLLPIADRELIDIDDYIDVRTILSSRSCTMKCSFCNVPNFWWDRRVRSPQSVVSEIEYLVNKFWAKKILFLDDNTTIEQDRIDKICDLLIEKNLWVSLGCLGNILNFDERIMNKMYLAWFRWIHYWIESGNPSVLASINKNFNLDEVRKNILKTKNIWFLVRTSWILDLPSSNSTAIEDTINLILETQTDEIRIHRLVKRLWSKLWLYVSLNNSWSQYIHGNFEDRESLNSDNLFDKTRFLKEQLLANNYRVLTNTEDNLNITKSDKKLVSFCPLKYWHNW